jgi:hypothetical protein
MVMSCLIFKELEEQEEREEREVRVEQAHEMEVHVLGQRVCDVKLSAGLRSHDLSNKKSTRRIRHPQKRCCIMQPQVRLHTHTFYDTRSRMIALVPKR